MNNEDAQKLAEKIAKMISGRTLETNLHLLLNTIDTVEKRLTALEAAVSNPKYEISNLQFSHPSQDRIAIAEAVVENLFATSTKEKACTFEPNGKPCDHCSMCNSRGF